MNNSKQNKWQIFFVVCTLFSLIGIISSCEKYDEVPPVKKQESANQLYKLPTPQGMSADDKQKEYDIKKEYQNYIK